MSSGHRSGLMAALLAALLVECADAPVAPRNGTWRWASPADCGRIAPETHDNDR